MLRSIALLALVAALPARGQVPAAPAREAAEGWVAFDLTPGNQIAFAAAVDGRPVAAILDTGVSHSVLARRYAETQRWRVTEEGRAQAIGGTVSLGRVYPAEVRVGSVVRRGGSLAVAPLPASATGTAAAVDLLVGRDLVGDRALDIDYARRRFRLLPSGQMPFAGAVAPLAIAPDRLVYVTTVTIGGRVLRPIVVDTGDGGSVTLSSAAWRSLRSAPSPVTDTLSIGVAGPVVSDLAVVPTLNVGSASASDVEVRLEAGGGFSDAIGVAGRIGAAFLQRFRVLLDPAAGRMVLAPEPAASPPARSTSGLLVGQLPDRLRVLHVMRGGPAAAAGWKNGDTICRIDGAPVAGMPIARAGEWTSGAAGRVVALTTCDGVVRPLALRRFY